jgi:hypothetical protein
MNAKPGRQRSGGKAAEMTAGAGGAWLFDIVNRIVRESRLIMRPRP